ncbi:MAG: DUF4266 domain-containing protein [Pseudomonadales bacterium]|nr:DUF4266 domain-containing protein [Pseudomonadales bacterium]MCP5185236.1 DUF4266 domain-containing protein [Pseudomonadales bacterium]
MRALKLSRNWLFLGLAVLASAGCVSLEPWVSPFERNHLADEIMSFDRAPVASAYMHHVHQAREGARGAEGGSGGGCGCN